MCHFLLFFLGSSCSTSSLVCSGRRRAAVAAMFREEDTEDLVPLVPGARDAEGGSAAPVSPGHEAHHLHHPSGHRVSMHGPGSESDGLMGLMELEELPGDLQPAMAMQEPSQQSFHPDHMVLQMEDEVRRAAWVADKH